MPDFNMYVATTSELRAVLRDELWRKALEKSGYRVIAETAVLTHQGGAFAYEQPAGSAPDDA